MPEPSPLLNLQSPRTKRTCAILILITILLGAGLRLTEFFSRPSYWNDEAAVVVNVINRDCRQLTQPLSYAQAAPPLFLWMERGLYRTFGAGEWSLRAFPLLLGLAAMPMLGLLAWRWLPPTSAFWVVALLAFSDKAIPHANEVKQYAADVFITIAILLASTEGFWLAAVVAAIGVWLSFPAIFIFAALSLVSLPLIRRRPVSFIAGNVLVAVSFASLWIFCLRHGHDTSLDTYWQASFPAWHRFGPWLGWQLYGFADYPVESFGLLTIGFLILGFVALAKQHRRTLLVLLPAALLVAFVAAAARRYPFVGHNRLSLYLLPVLLLILGAAAEPQDLKLRGWLLRWYWLLFAPLLIISIGQAGRHLLMPEESSTTRQITKYIQAYRHADEPMMLVGDSDQPGSDFSGRNVEMLCYWPHPAGQVVDRFIAPSAIDARRFWVIYSLKRPENNPGAFAHLLEQRLGDVRVMDAHQVRGQSGAILVEKKAVDAK